jgi:hypothetical protein
MRFSVQKGGRYLAALMVALMLLWSLSLVLPGQADATTGHETTEGNHDGGDEDHEGDHGDDGGQCSPGHDGKTGGKDDCDDDHDSAGCPTGHHEKTGDGKDDCDDGEGDDHDCPVQTQGNRGQEDCDSDDDCPVHLQDNSGGDQDEDCDSDDDCPVQLQGNRGGDHDDDDCDDETTTTTTTIPGSSSTTTVGVTVTTTLDIAAAGAVCRNDIPYLGYDIDWPGGGTATITFLNPTGADIVHEGMPLEGEVLWPGANDDPADWPGWILQDGIWVEGNDGFLWARGAIQVQFEVNPTAVVSVSYPPASVACAGPENIPDLIGGVTVTPPPSDDVGGVTVLPFTGIDPGPLAAVAFAALTLGTLLVVAGRKDEIGEN